MKKWIAEFKSSLALDGRNENVRTQDNTLNAVHARLSGEVRRAEPPEDLHFSIMRSVRNSNESSAALPHKKPRSMQLAFGVGCACVLGVTLAIMLRQPPSHPMEPTITAVQNTIESISASSTETRLLNPLEQELESVRRDLQQTADHLLASVP